MGSKSSKVVVRTRDLPYMFETIQDTNIIEILKFRELNDRRNGCNALKEEKRKAFIDYIYLKIY